MEWCDLGHTQGETGQGSFVARRAGVLVLESRYLARFRRRLSRGAWLFPRCRSFSRFGCRFSRRLQFHLGVFRSAMVAMIQRLDASGLFFCTQLSVSIFLALVLKVFRNRFRCHSQSVAELCPSKLSNFGHFVTIQGRICQPFRDPGAGSRSKVGPGDSHRGLPV